MSNLKPTSPHWQVKLLEDLEALESAYELKTPQSIALKKVHLIIENLEAEFSNEGFDPSKFEDCPKCGNTKNAFDNFCPKCGWFNGYCKHEETGYRQDGILFCLNCKTVLLDSGSVL